MTTTKVDFTDIKWFSVQWTMLGTLYLRAYESRNRQSILADHAAVEAVDRIEYDFKRLKRFLLPQTNQFTVALRAWRFDSWAAEFLERHPNAVVLHLGCGLDSRPFRLDLPDGVDWYDVDVPQVIELRRRLYDDTDRYHMIGSSVTETAWLERIPADRPALMIAEGLLMYIRPQEVRDLFQRITDRFKTGELLFDVLAPWWVRLSSMQHWAVKDVGEIERWNPRLRHLETVSPMSPESCELIPSKGYRRLFRTFGRARFMRNAIRELRFTF